MDEPAILYVLYEVKLNTYFDHSFFSLVPNGYYLVPEPKMRNPKGELLTVQIPRQLIHEYPLNEVNSNLSPADEVPLD